MLLFTGFSVFEFVKEKLNTSKEKMAEKRAHRKEEKVNNKIKSDKNLEETMSHVIISNGEDEEEQPDNKKVITSYGNAKIVNTVLSSDGKNLHIRMKQKKIIQLKK